MAIQCDNPDNYARFMAHFNFWKLQATVDCHDDKLIDSYVCRILTIATELKVTGWKDDFDLHIMHAKMGTL